MKTASALHMSPVELGERMIGVVSDLHTLASEYDEALLEEARVNGAYKAELAKCFLLATGPVEERKMSAQQVTHELFVKWARAEAIVKAMKERIQILRDELVAYECIMSTMKTEMNLTGIAKKYA